MIRILLAACLTCVLGLGPTYAGPQLPVPPAPPTAVDIISTRLVEQVWPRSHTLSSSANFGIQVQLEGSPKAPARFLSFVAGKIEDRLRLKGLKGARNPSAQLVVEIKLRRVGGDLFAEAQFKRRPLTVWERLRQPHGQRLGSGTARAPLDLQTRILLELPQTPLPKRPLTLKPLPYAPKARELGARFEILAIRIVDLDHDGHTEICVLQPDRLLIYQHRGTQLSEVAKHPLTLVRASRARPRQPMGQLVVVTETDGRKVLVVASSNYAHPQILRWTGQALRIVPASVGQLAWPLYATHTNRVVAVPWPRAQDVLRGDIMIQNIRTGSGRTVGHLGPHYVVTVAPGFIATSGAKQSGVAKLVRWKPTILRESTDMHLHIGSLPQPVKDQGTAMTLADINHDGVGELVTTSSSLNGKDALRFWQVRSQGKPIKVAALKTPHRVTALASGDLDRDGQTDFVVALWTSRGARLQRLLVGTP